MDEGDRRGIDARLDRVTIQEAARRLGISEGAVRKRVTRNTLRHDKAPDGRVFVYLDGGVDDGVDVGVDASPSALIAQLRDEIAYLREESRRKDEIIMQQATTMRQITAAVAKEPAEAAETVEEEPEGAESQPDAAGPQVAADDATVDGPESESPASLEDEYNEEQERSRKHREAFARLLGETREEAKATRRRPWWRRVFGR